MRRRIHWGVTETLWRIENRVALVGHYGECRLMCSDKAQELGIQLLFLPPYSPNLNLIERLWKFTKKQCLYNRYYPSFNTFKQAIDTCLNQVSTSFKESIKTLLAPNFQLLEIPQL